jgi:Fibronectin type III domain
MKKDCFLIFALGGILLSASGCGDNLAGPPVSVSAPRNLKALSVDESTVFLQWNAPSDVDSAFGGYRLEYGSDGIDLSRNQISYTATSLQPGEQVFTVFSLRSNGTKADGASIRWAPATRFDSVYSLLEYSQLQTGRASGINVGSVTTSPFTLEVNGSAANVLDFYLYGGDGFSQEPLALYAADQFAGAFRPTRFSTVTHSSSSLDLPLTSFPADTTFIRESVPVASNTIYYARVVINAVEVHFVRIHVRQRAGTTYPDRVIELHISLQRVAGLLFADNGGESSRVLPGPAPSWNVQLPNS